eukprot:1050475-Prymnesium_polylepis.1
MSSLQGSAARQLDVLSMMLCPAAYAWRRTTVRSRGSVGAKDGAHLCSGPVAGSHKKTFCASETSARPRPGWIQVDCCWPSSIQESAHELADPPVSECEGARSSGMD